MAPQHSFMALKRAAIAVRRQLIHMHYTAKSGHLGTGLSALDVLTYLYTTHLRPQDVFVLSKGHGASALYAMLHHTGKLSDTELASYYQDNTLLPAHPAAQAHASIRIATGSLGHGLPVTAGMAYSHHYLLKPSDAHFYCMVSDGECNEGTVWEAAMFASHHKLSNLTVIVDANGLQGFGRTHEVINMEPFVDKWLAFGYQVHEIDGHDFSAMQQAFALRASRPTCIIARTIKGKGVSFMQDKLEWHYLTLDKKHYEQALHELNGAEQELNHAC